MTAHSEKQRFLESYGYSVGTRNPRINTDYPGAFMVVEPFEDDELPTKDGSNGPWAICGDDLNDLIDEAYDFLVDFIDPVNETESSQCARAAIATA